MKYEPHKRYKVVYVREKETDDVFVPRRLEIPVREVRAEKKKEPKGSTGRSLRRGATTALGVLALAVMVTMAGSAKTTFSYFSDSEFARNNPFAAGLLDFIVSPDFFDRTVTNADGDGVYIDPSVTTEAGSFQLQYKVAIEETGGPSALCAALQATATTSALTYGGPLLTLAAGPTTSVGPWELFLSLPSDVEGLVDGDMCEFDLVYTGWADQMPEGEGYQDEERVHVSIMASLIAQIQEGVQSFRLLVAPEETTEENTEEEQPQEDGDTPPEEVLLDTATTTDSGGEVEDVTDESGDENSDRSLRGDREERDDRTPPENPPQEEQGEVPEPEEPITPEEIITLPEEPTDSSTTTIENTENVTTEVSNEDNTGDQSA